jgi:hypothetical protein
MVWPKIVVVELLDIEGNTTVLEIVEHNFQELELATRY